MNTAIKRLIFAGLMSVSPPWLLGETIVVTSTNNQTQSVTVTVPYCADIDVHGNAYGPPYSYITGNTPIGSFYYTPSSGSLHMTGTVQAGTYTIYENVGYSGYLCVMVMLHSPVWISGESSLWHYQGPYAQPNDETSVNEEYPAPPITLTANHPYGGTGSDYQWTILEGSDKVRFSGSTTSSTVQIEGIGMSSQVDDVRIKVTATVNGQNATSAYSLTVKEPVSVTMISSTTTAAYSPNYGYFTEILYEVRDQFGSHVGAHVAVDETVTACHNPYNGGLLVGDTATDGDGRFNDPQGVEASSPLPYNFCTKWNQTFKVGGSGVVKTQTIVKNSVEATVQNGGCSPGASCP